MAFLVLPRCLVNSVNLILILSLRSHIQHVRPQCAHSQYGVYGPKNCVKVGADTGHTVRATDAPDQRDYTETNGDLFKGKYSFNVTAIPRLSCDDPEAFGYLERQV